MTFIELLTSCSKGTLPLVLHEKFGVGCVTTIKHQSDGSKFKGCAVRFYSIPYDTWFSDSDDTDKRSKYMRELILYNENR